MPGIEPGAFHMQSERSTTELHPLSGELPFFIPTVSSCGIKKDIWVFLRRPGIEPGAQEWESCMLPLHQRRLNGGFLAPSFFSKLWLSLLRMLKCGTLHDFACHPCAGAMLIFSVSFQF